MFFGKRKFPYYPQLDAEDCGPACVRMIASWYGKKFSAKQLTERADMYRQGISLSGLSELAEKAGFRSLCVQINLQALAEKSPLPCIAFWNQKHFIVIYKITKTTVYVSDPALGLIRYTPEEFSSKWAVQNSNGSGEGIILLLEPTPQLFEMEGAPPKNKASFSFLLKYLFRYKKQLVQLCFAFLLGSLFQLVLPFLTQYIVDYGVLARDLNFIYIILAAQLLLFISMISAEFIRAWILIHISSRINIYLISDFLVKLMRLPIKYFDGKILGDLTQRIQDHRRVEQYLTNTLLQSVFSVFSILVFSIIIFGYYPPVFFVFLAGTVIEVLWIFAYLKKARMLDNKSFALMAQDQNKVFELLTGMQEIKLNNIEQEKRWEWETIQSSLFKVNLAKLKLHQAENGGSRFIGYLQMVLMIFLTALAVVNGLLSIGAMMAIIFIVGQMNAPISQLINFVLQTQMAKISLERLSEIHTMEDEEPEDKQKLRIPVKEQDIQLDNISFSYAGNPQPVLRDVQLVIPSGKVTAIVGVSGSGKTTLLKLLLKFYEPQQGNITIGNTALSQLHSSYWREQCGTVLQDSFIFSDTLVKNIALKTPVNEQRLKQAVEVANIEEFIESLPMKYETRIGQDGMGLSQGQRQRLLIARAVYKNPHFLFFDEATNALDAENELVIMRNLEKFFAGKTVVIVAHRLSTVKNADQIIVIDKGIIAEHDRHEKLVANRHKYFELIKNQLELGA